MLKESELSFQIMSTNHDDSDGLTNTQRGQKPNNHHPYGHGTN